ncbi:MULTISPECIES: hypothetical protein [unclassified Streptomyces]|uniref:hypothetical protein n=1 Tax=Streptomyces sp. NRRL F-4428 TaxID=1609137 RepID=UPI0005EC854D|nr:hypothetical protein [Streptomyces sp. NRRL F-4428]
MHTLLDLLQSIDERPAEGLVYAAKPWTAGSVAAVAAVDEPPPHLDYLLEVEPIHDVNAGGEQLKVLADLGLNWAQ